MVTNTMKKMKQRKALENNKSRILHRTVRETFLVYNIRSEGVSPVDVGRKRGLGRGVSRYKGSLTEACLAYSRDIIKKLSIAYMS